MPRGIGMRGRHGGALTVEMMSVSKKKKKKQRYRRFYPTAEFKRCFEKGEEKSRHQKCSSTTYSDDKPCRYIGLNSIDPSRHQPRHAAATYSPFTRKKKKLLETPVCFDQSLHCETHFENNVEV